jgi:hypothetical protein
MATRQANALLHHEADTESDRLKWLKHSSSQTILSL